MAKIVTNTDHTVYNDVGNMIGWIEKENSNYVYSATLNPDNLSTMDVVDIAKALLEMNGHDFKLVLVDK